MAASYAIVCELGGYSHYFLLFDDHALSIFWEAHRFMIYGTKKEGENLLIRTYW